MEPIEEPQNDIYNMVEEMMKVVNQGLKEEGSPDRPYD
jgi:hypothetical protein